MRDRVSFNAALNGLSGHHWPQGLALTGGLEPDLVTMGTLMVGCEERWALVLQLRDEVVYRHMRPGGAKSS